MTKIYTPSRIKRGEVGYRLAADVIAQRGRMLDITRITPARWLDMRLEDATPEGIAALVGYEERLQEIIDQASADDAQSTMDALTAAAEEFVPAEHDRIARFRLFDAIRDADRLYGRAEVAAFISAYHPAKAAILAVIAA